MDTDEKGTRNNTIRRFKGKIIRRVYDDEQRLKRLKQMTNGE